MPPLPAPARLLLAAGGLGLAVHGMLTLSLPRMAAGAALWVAGLAAGDAR